MESILHPLFRDVPPGDAKLWRYLSFAKLASLLQSESLHFTRVDRFDDHFEGARPRLDLEYWLRLEGFNIPSFTEQMKRKNVAASCWVESPQESAAMWRLYAPGNDGVAVTTTFGKLQALVGAAEKTEHIGLGGVGRVRYLDHASEGLIAALAKDDPLPNSLAPFMLKHVSYAHEKEVRGLLVASWGAAEILREGCALPIKAADFIDEIVVNPFAEQWLVETTAALVDRYSLRSKCRRSRLARDSFYMRVLENERSVEASSNAVARP